MCRGNSACPPLHQSFFFFSCTTESLPPHHPGHVLFHKQSRRKLNTFSVFLLHGTICIFGIKFSHLDQAQRPLFDLSNWLTKIFSKTVTSPSKAVTTTVLDYESKCTFLSFLIFFPLLIYLNPLL